MEVLKQTSPTEVPVAPNDSPSKIRPSSNARSALGEREAGCGIASM
jgi:hypothetical protein